VQETAGVGSKSLARGDSLITNKTKEERKKKEKKRHRKRKQQGKMKSRFSKLPQMQQQ